MVERSERRMDKGKGWARNTEEIKMAVYFLLHFLSN
jgi:hypothetical protein